METCINYCEPGFAYISSDERRWINRMNKLADEYPDDCTIIKRPEDNGGFIYCRFPQKWARVNPPKRVAMTDEEKARRAVILLQSRRSGTNNHRGETTDGHE